jgi:hypothetical protein
MFSTNKKGLLIGLTLFSASAQVLTTAQASELDLALGKETAAVEVYLDASRVNGDTNTTVGNVSIGGLYNENDDLLGFIGLDSNSSRGYNSPYELGVGVRAYYLTVDEPDVSVGAIALGISGKVKFNVGVPLALAGDFHYAPKITTFNDGDEVVDSRLRLEGEVSQSSTAFVGYRRIKLNLKEHSNYKLDDHVQVGIRFKF